MNVSDPIADMLTRIRNGSRARHSEILVPASRTKRAIAQILSDEGFIEGFEDAADGNHPQLKLRLKYVGKVPVISGMKRVSKPGKRIYSRYTEIPWVLSGLGIAILSTPSGLMTGEQARRQKVGGEILCYVW